MQCLRDYIFLPLSYVFALKLRESLLKSLKITLKKMVKSKLRCRKTVQSFTEKFFSKEKTLQTTTRSFVFLAFGSIVV